LTHPRDVRRTVRHDERMRPVVALLLLAGCTVAQGTIAILVRQVELPAMAIVFYRVALAAATIALLVILLRRRELLRLANRAPLALGLLLAVHWSFYFAAIQETSIASAVVVTYVAPVFVALLAPAVLNERVTWVSGAALLASLGGVGLISLGGGAGEVRLFGVALALLAALTFALLLVLFKRYASDLDPVTVVFYESTVAAIFLAPAAVLADYSLDAGQVGALLALGVVLTGVVTVLFVAALRWVPVTTAGVLTYLEPVSAALLAVALLGESLTVPVVLGGVTIVAAGIVVLVTAASPEAAN